LGDQETDMEDSLGMRIGSEFKGWSASSRMAQQTQSRVREDTDEPNEYKTEEVVDGTVVRITGAGNFVVYPVSKGSAVRKGNPVRIVVAEKMVSPMVSIEAREERISTPISSSWAVVVSTRQSIERCRVFYNRVQLSTVDHMGQAKSELRMARDSSLSFHIPDSMELDDAYPVQVRDGDRLLRSEAFGSINTVTAPGTPTNPMPAKTTTTTTTTTS